MEGGSNSSPRYNVSTKDVSFRPQSPSEISENNVNSSDNQSPDRQSNPEPSKTEGEALAAAIGL
jgi:hypothetical protein